MEKDRIFEIEIEDMSSEGHGIGRIRGERTNCTEDCVQQADMLEGLVVFVPGAVPGDIAKVQLTKVKKKYAFSKLIGIDSASPGRNEEICPYSDSVSVKALTGREEAKACGGCPFGRMKYEVQLKLKEKQVREKLERLAGADFAGNGEGPVLREIAGMDEECCYRYRNKAVMPISTGGLMTRKGGIQEPVHEPRIGFLPSRSNDVIDCGDCWLQAPSAMAAAEATRRFMREDNITSYDQRWDKGLMKSMTVKTAFGTGEVMVIYEINGKGIPNAAKLAQMLDDEIYEAGVQLSGDGENPALSLESIVLKNTGGKKKSGAGEGRKAKIQTLVGKNTITDVVEFEGAGELQFEISAESFYQVNHTQMKRLYGVVREFVKRSAAENKGNPDTKPVILDLYCGIGTIGLSVADLAEHVYGIEIVKDAVLDANRNATINGIVNATYACGRAEELIPLWFEGKGDVDFAKAEEADIAILDPPRAGCRPELLQAIAEAEIPDIIYVSCDPSTLARDIRLLSDGIGGGCRYKLVEAAPVDMFPHTGHVECVVLLTKHI